MRRLLIVLIGIMIFNAGQSQPCLPEGITFTTQTQIDNFKNNHPGCTEIEGDVLISGNNITNFYGLNEIVSIGGDLTIQNCNQLGSLPGFDYLYHIEGSLSIRNNSSLRKLRGIESIMSMGGTLRISNNQSLIDLFGIGNATSIGGDLIIDSNLVLDNIHALYGIKSIGTIPGTGKISINYNSALKSLNSLGNINSGTIDELHISFNPWLSDCDMACICEFLGGPGGVIDIHDNGEGCNSPEEVSEDCTDNCLRGGMQIFDQEQIDSIPILYPDCKEIMGRLYIDDYNDGYILNLYGFENITSIAGYLVIGHSPRLHSLQGLDSLMTIGGSLYLDSNDSLEGLHNLSKLTSLLGNLQIDNISMMTNLSGLENLNYIGSDIILVFNANLTDLSALSNINKIGSGITIWDNPSLTSLTGLDNIEANSISSLYFRDNSLLSECEVNSICYYLMIPGKSAYIVNNATGCNNADEILDKCEVDIDEDHPASFSVYPNPVTDYITVDFSDDFNLIRLYNLTGQLLISETALQSGSRIDISFLKSGIYVMRLIGDANASNVKIVKY